MVTINKMYWKVNRQKKQVVEKVSYRKKKEQIKTFLTKFNLTLTLPRHLVTYRHQIK